MRNNMVSPFGIRIHGGGVEFIQKDRGQGGDPWMDVGSAFVHNVPGRSVTFVGVSACDVLRQGGGGRAWKRTLSPEALRTRGYRITLPLE
jgi:hypothetical protein